MKKLLCLLLFALVIFSAPAFAQHGQGQVVGYYQSWRHGSNPIRDQDLDRLTHLVLFQVFPQANGNLNLEWWSNTWSTHVRNNLIPRAHARNVRVIVTVGGGFGQHGGRLAPDFWNAMRNQTSRTNFVNNMVNMVNSYGFDGICLDWEYPNAGWYSGGQPNDWRHYMALLRELRNHPGMVGKRISVAMGGDTPFPRHGNHFNTGNDNSVREYVRQHIWLADAIHLMTYDMIGAPLQNPNGTGWVEGTTWPTHADPDGAERAMRAWAAWGAGQPGFHPEKLLIGIATYPGQGPRGDNVADINRKINFTRDNGFGGAIVWEIFPGGNHGNVGGLSHDNDALWNAIWNANQARGGWTGDSPAVVNRTVTVTYNAHGNVRHGNTTVGRGNSVSVQSGDNLTLNLNANNGYSVTNIRVNGNTIPSAATHTFNNITSDQTIDVTFARRMNVPGNFNATDYSLKSNEIVYTDDEHGRYVGYLTNNSSLEYMLNVTQAGAHIVRIETAIGDNAARTVTLYNGNSTTALGTLNAAGGNSWFNFTNAETEVTLPQGNMTLRLVVNGAINIKDISITRVGGGSDPDPDPDPGGYPDLADGNFLWDSMRDDFGSTANVNVVSAANVTFGINVSESSGAWAKVVCYSGGDYSDVTSISITYTASSDITLTLVDDNGWDAAGRGFRVVLPAGTHTRDVPLSQFSQLDTDWTTEIPLNMSYRHFFEGVSISVSAGSSVNGTLSSLVVNGLFIDDDGNTSVIPQSKTRERPALAANAFIANGTLNLSLPAGINSANIALYDVRGRLLFERSVTVSGNFTNLALPQSLVRNQAAILQIRTNSGFSMTKRVLVK